MQLLQKLAKDMVAVLLNVFSKMPRESRGMVGDVIGIWIGVMTEKVDQPPQSKIEFLMGLAGCHRHLLNRHLPPLPEPRLP